MQAHMQSIVPVMQADMQSIVPVMQADVQSIVPVMQADMQNIVTRNVARYAEHCHKECGEICRALSQGM